MSQENLFLSAIIKEPLTTGPQEVVKAIDKQRRKIQQLAYVEGPGPHFVDPASFTMVNRGIVDGQETFELQATTVFRGIDRAGDTDIAVAHRAHSPHPRVNAGSVPFAAWDAAKLAALLQGIKGEFRSLKLVTTTRKTVRPDENITMKGKIRFRPRRGPGSEHRMLFGIFQCNYCNAAGNMLATTECEFAIVRARGEPTSPPLP